MKCGKRTHRRQNFWKTLPLFRSSVLSLGNGDHTRQNTCNNKIGCVVLVQKYHLPGLELHDLQTPRFYFHLVNCGLGPVVTFCLLLSGAKFAQNHLQPLDEAPLPPSWVLKLGSRNHNANLFQWMPHMFLLKLLRVQQQSRRIFHLCLARRATGVT